MRAYTTLLLLIACGAISACTQDAPDTSPWVLPPTETISCAEYVTEANVDGVLYNNVWNKGAAGSFDWRQCLEKDAATGFYGWSWVWPTKSRDIFAYPQIKVGASPWAPTPNLRTDIPARRANIGALLVSYELELLGASEHNIATTAWLTRSEVTGEKPMPELIVAELMIWTYATAQHMNPAGKHVGDVDIGGVQWELWAEKNWGDASGVNANKWVNLTFRAKTYSLKSAFDLVQLTDYAVEQKILPDDFYFADVELGMEIMSGSGLAWVKAFRVSVEK